MPIQWFPGHMHKASKEIRKILPKVDIVIEILDARIPHSSDNPMLAEIRGDKPCIKVLNKSDLADPERTREWQAYLEREQGVKTLALSTDQVDKVKQLTGLCHKMLPGRDDGIKSIHAMIMGIPNVGKSTLINILAGKSITKTGNEPAITKTQQRIRLDDAIVLSDTPGVLWAKFDHENIGYRLATTGAIKDTAIDHDDVAFFAVNYLKQHYPEELKRRYELEHLPDSELELLELIGAKRGCLRAGGQVELDKVGKLLLNELRAGLLGRITLETPAEIEQELVETRILKEQKAARKEARKQKWKKSRS
jgi:ribosome biogenesis GTPase A